MVAVPQSSPPRKAPVYPGLPVVGSLLEVRRDMIAFFERAVRLGDIVELKFPARIAFVFNHPNHAKHIFVDHYRNYGKQTRGYHLLRMVLGQGLVTSEGEFWRRQRRIAQPAFQHGRIAHFGEVMSEETERMLARWDRESPAALDLDHALMTLTLTIVGRCLMSADLSDESDAVGQAVTVMLRQTVYRLTHPLMLPLGFPTPKNRAFLASRAELDRLVYGIIEERRLGKLPPKPDLLSMLIEAKDEETGEGMTDLQLRDEVMTMILAGHETTANALNWTFYLLAQHPRVSERLLEEVSSLGSGPLGVAELARLPYTEGVIKEAMRLYPPVWIIARSATEADVIDGVSIPAGAMCFVSPWTHHRDPRFFEAPLEFRPERFLGEAEAAIGKYSYFPFAMGPRVCIGNGFAMMEARLLLSAIHRRYALALSPEVRVELEPSITLRPRHGLKMALKRR